MATASKRLAIVIINYRTPALLEDCLESLEGQLDHSRDVVVVVDNASGDGSVDRIKESIERRDWEHWVRLIPSEVNGGFSAGNNIGIRAADARNYLLINSDTLVRPGAVDELIEAAEAHPYAGLIGPRLEWPDGTPQISAFRFPSPMSEFINAASTGPFTRLLRRYNVPLPLSDDCQVVDWTSFACVLIKKEVFDDVGLLDDGYFMYFEDADFCRRAVNAGWKVMYWPHAHVVHLRGGSGPIKSMVTARKRRPRRFYAARTRYFAKFYGLLGLWTANILWDFGRFIALFSEITGRRAPHNCAYAYVDIWTNALSPLKNLECTPPANSAPTDNDGTNKRSHVNAAGKV